MPEIISRKEAIARGLKRYFTGKPCKRGHIDQRYVSGNGCITCLYARIKQVRSSACLGLYALIKERRDAALAQGLSTYEAVKPCKHGHKGKKRIRGHKCVQCETIRKGQRRRSGPRLSRKEENKKWQERRKKATIALRALEELGIKI